MPHLCMLPEHRPFPRCAVLSRGVDLPDDAFIARSLSVNRPTTAAVKGVRFTVVTSAGVAGSNRPTPAQSGRETRRSVLLRQPVSRPCGSGRPRGFARRSLSPRSRGNSSRSGRDQRSPPGKQGNLDEPSHYEESVTDMGPSTNSSRKFTALRLLQDGRERLNVLLSCFRGKPCAEHPDPERRESIPGHRRGRTDDS